LIPHFGSIALLRNQQYERYLPSAFDESMTLVQKVNMVIEHLNVTMERMNDLQTLTVDTMNEQTVFLETNIQTQYTEISDLYDAFTLLKEWLENEGLEDRLVVVLNGWFDTGKLAEIINNEVFDMKANQIDLDVINEQLADIATNAKKFGVTGDGITDDTINIITAFNYCIENNRVLLFPSGEYLFKKSSVPLESIYSNSYGNFIKCSSMIGEDSTIIVDGLIGFDTSEIENLKVSELKFKLINGYGTDITENDINVVFYNSDLLSVTKIRLYQHLMFEGIVDLENGSQRYGAAIYERVFDSGYFNNIVTKNLVTGVRVIEGKNFSVDTVKSFNFQTCIYTSNDCFNYDVNNILAENTFNQSQTWLRKNHLTNPRTSFNGLDLFLGAGDNYQLNNLNAINPIERCVYSQGSNVNATQLRCVNGHGFKFVGQGYEDIKKNIKVSNTHLIVDRETVGTVQGSFSHSAIYWVENIEFDNCKVTDNGTSTGGIGKIFELNRKSKNVKISNVNCGRHENSLAYIVLREELGLTPEDYIVVDNLEIENCYIEKDNGRSGSLLSIRTIGSSVDAQLTYAMRNVSIKNSKIKYYDNPDTFWYNFNYADGFYAEGNSANKRCEFQAGIPIVEIPITNNIVLREKNITFSTLSVLLNALKTYNMSQGSKLNLIKDKSNGRVQELNVTLYGALETTNNVFYNCDMEITSYLTIYESFTDLPLNYTIEINSTDGYYLGQVSGATVTNLINTPPFAITYSINGIILRGDLYAGKAVVRIKAAPKSV